MTSLSEEDIIKIVNNYLLSSPPGEFTEVVADVRALVNNDNLLNTNAQHTFRDYNTAQLVICTPPNSEHKMLISEFGEVDESHYLDTRGKKLVTFDHFKQEITEVADADAALFPASTEGFRIEFEKQLLDYVEDHYPAGCGAVFAKEKDGKMEFTLCISAAKFNPGNFWNGRWRSIWSVSFATGDASANLTGKFDLDVHYYEDGNVQLKAKQDKTLDVDIKDAATTAKNVLGAITKVEGAYQLAVEEHFNTMSDTTFKQLRRKLPVTKDKINWSKMAGYKLGAEMQGNQK